MLPRLEVVAGVMAHRRAIHLDLVHTEELCTGRCKHLDLNKYNSREQ